MFAEFEHTFAFFIAGTVRFAFEGLNVTRIPKNTLFYNSYHKLSPLSFHIQVWDLVAQR